MAKDPEYLTQAIVDGLKPRDRQYAVADFDRRPSSKNRAVKGLAVRVYPSGAKKWAYRYWFNGERRTHLLGDAANLPLHKAREAARAIQMRADLARAGVGEDPKPKPPAAPEPGPAPAPTVIEWINGPYAEALRLRRTRDEMLRALNVTLSDKVKETRIDDPGLRAAVIEWRNETVTAARTPQTVNRYTEYLRAALTHAVEADMLPINPLHRLKKLKEPTEHRVRYLSEDEEARLWDALDRREERIRAGRESANAWRMERGYSIKVDLRTRAYADYLKPIVVLAIHTGMRRGEIFSLEWGDLDLEARVLTVRGAIAKSGKARRIPLNAAAIEMLEAWGGPGVSRKGLVFPSPATGGRLDHISTAWKSLMKDAQIEGFRFHDLRHHFASCLVMDGVPLNTVRELLGHSTLDMTLRYAHLAPEAGHEAVARLALRHQRHQNVTPFPAKRGGDCEE